MKYLVLPLICVSFSTTVAGAQAPSAKEDMARLQGAWKCVEGNVAGKKLGESDAAALQMTFTFKGDRLTKLVKGKSTESLNVTLNAMRTPREIDTVQTDGPARGTKSRGIYALDGDTLKWCFRDKLNGRPGKFDVPEGTDDVFLVLRKEVVIVYKRSLLTRMLGYTISPVIQAGVVEMQKK